MIDTIGFLSMQFEKAEKRDFRPDFFGKIADLPISILLDDLYGAKLNFTKQDYINRNANIKFCSRGEVLKADCIVTIRTPDFSQLSQLKRGAIFFSMLHYLTRKNRNQFLLNNGVKMLAMDSVVDDFGNRIVQDFPGTAENAFIAIYRECEKFIKEKEIIKVLILGHGEIGKICVEKAIKLVYKPIIVTVAGRSVTSQKIILNKLLSESDILVDATKRDNPSKYIISNDQINLLPIDAVILDISADDYDVQINPIQVKGIEGIPTGNMDKYIFYPDDIAYDNLPKQISSRYRRLVLSCCSWPGLNPNRCLDRYEIQLEPLIRIIAKNGYNLALDSVDPYERALARSQYNYYLNSLRQ